MKLFKLLLSVAGATVLLGALVSTASAGRLSSSHATLRSTFSRVDFTGGFGTVECAITLEGSLHSRSINKVPLGLIGSITRAIVGVCPRGSATILQESLPWNVRYMSFTGTLPNITAINVRVLYPAFRIREPTFGITCLALTENEEPSFGTFSRDTVSRTLTTARITGEVETDCGTSGTLSSNAGPITVLNSTSRITVTLI